MKSRPEARPRKTPVVARKRALLTVVYGRGSAHPGISLGRICDPQANKGRGAENTRK